MEWKTVKLGDCLSKIIDNRGKTPKDLVPSGHPLLEINAVSKNNKYPLYGEAKKYVDDVVYSTWFRSGHPQYGDILVPTVGTLGAVAYVGRNDCCIAQNLIALRANTDICDSAYIYYVLCNPQIVKRLLNLDIGAVQASIKVPHLLALEIPLPPLETQRRIAAILSSLDDKIENNNRINRNLEAQAQALFKSWFVDFEPFGGKMPEGWKEGSLYNYVDVIYGAPYQSALFNEHSEGLPLIRIRDLKTNSPQVSTTEILPNTEYIEAGDIVAGMDAEFSPYLWKGEKGLLNQRCCKFKANDSSISNYYVLFLVKPKLEYVQSYKTGTTVSHLGKADIDRFNVIIPPIEIVRKFSTQVDAMKELVVSNALESARLAALRDTLLPKLMKGEIAV